MRANNILVSDSYKPSHWLQMPPNTSRMTYYLESRGGRYSATMFAGLQIELLGSLVGQFITPDDIDEAGAFLEQHGEPFNEAGWRLLLSRHNGRLPIRVCAVAEGTVVPTHNVMMTVENTDPDFFWLPSYLETRLLRAVWYPTTVATRSYFCKRVIHRYLHETSESPALELPFKLHDFGARGVSSGESAAIGGCAHLFNFMGSDTMEGIVYAQRFYDAKGMPSFSIPAAEHSTITSWGREREVDAYRNAVNQFAKPGKMFAVVSDSYDLMNVVEKVWGGELKREVEESGATLVVRPDSGHPPTVVLEVVQALARSCGETRNSLGYRVLPKWLRVIQGDGNDSEADIEAILANLKAHGFSASNVAFGMGGGLLQKLDRDTQRFAFKCSEAVVDGKAVKVFKDPKTDPEKRSKAGRMSLVHRGGGYQTVEGDASDSLLVPVFENGAVLKTYTLDEVRKNAGREFA
jgi:nicotinamide phosphoribosyltransferase